MIKNIKILALASLVFVACEKEDEVVTPVTNSSDGLALTSGTANFTKFVSLGNSLTAGFSDNALFRDGQLGSWTNILAEQFKLVGGGEYKIPLTNNNVGGLVFGGSPNPSFGPRLYFTGAGVGVAAGAGVTPNEVFSPTVGLGGPYNNVGVPGAKSFHLLFPGYGQASNLSLGTANPYYVRFASQTTPKSMLDYAFDQSPTFFSLWIGNNDVLGFATAGGVTTAQDPASGGDLTPIATFTSVYNAIINKMTTNAKGVVANIPDVSTIPFFTTVPFNPVTLPAANATALNAGFVEYNGGLALAANAGIITAAEKTKRTINFQEGNNPVVIEDEYLTSITLGSNTLPKYRQATAKDLLVLTSRTFIGTTVAGNPQLVNGVSVPLADKWVLSVDEVAEIKTATTAFNQVILDAATSKGLAFVDANKLLSDIYNFGISDSGYTLKSTFITGGAFSLDGVHPAPRGYALIANAFIKEINKTYGSNIKTVDLGNYKFLYPAVLGDGNK